MSARRGVLDYTCELCRAKLCCHLTVAARFELFMLSIASVVVWTVQAMSAARMVQLVISLFAVSWHNSTHIADGKFMLPTGLLCRIAASLFPPPASIPASCEAQVGRTVGQCAIAGFVVCVAWYTMACFRRPLVFHAEGLLDHLCVVKIGACMDVLIYEGLSRISAAPKAAPPEVWRVLVATLALDVLLLSFIKVKRDLRHDIRGMLDRLIRAVVRVMCDIFPFAAMFFLWFVSIAMIVAASFVPCVGILCHEAVRDICRRRYRHGSVQMMALMLRLTMLALTSLFGWEWAEYDGVVCTAHVALEIAIIADLFACKRGNCLAWDVPSQILWTIALSGQCAFTLRGPGSTAWTQGFDAAGALAGLGGPPQFQPSAKGPGRPSRALLPEALERRARRQGRSH